MSKFCSKCDDFNPRSPWGERPPGSLWADRRIYFNPRSPWGERREFIQLAVSQTEISIHAPRGGSDNLTPVSSTLLNNFNPRSPWGERPVDILIVSLHKGISIHAPRGGSDAHGLGPFIYSRNFNPRSPWGERPAIMAAVALSNHFNPRSPWGERRAPPSSVFTLKVFQSTLPVGGATLRLTEESCGHKISIHAPRGGSDIAMAFVVDAFNDFNPRSPWGERPSPGADFTGGAQHFNPRSPWGERHLKLPETPGFNIISIHAPRGGSDSKDAQFSLSIFGKNNKSW